jgi:hypothetical protein
MFVQISAFCCNFIGQGDTDPKYRKNPKTGTGTTGVVLDRSSYTGTVPYSTVPDCFFFIFWDISAIGYSLI